MFRPCSWLSLLHGRLPGRTPAVRTCVHQSMRIGWSGNFEIFGLSLLELGGEVCKTPALG